MISIENWKSKILEAFTQAFNNGNYQMIDELFAADAVGIDRARPSGAHGPAGVKELVQNFRDAFPDIHVQIEYQIADGDRIASKWAMTGTHKGKFMGKAPTGKKVNLSAVSIDRVADGKVVEYNTFRDDLGFIQQIEAVAL